MKNSRLIPAALFVLILGTVAFACQVPVFRYALENWEPDQLTIAILHNGQQQEATKQLIATMESAAEADENRVNLRVHPIDVSVEHPAGSAEAFHAAAWKDKPLPHMLVFFSNDRPEPHQAWSAPLNQQTVNQLLESPARTQVAARLLAGQSAVWILLKSGDKLADEKAEKMLSEQLQRQPDLIELPSLTDLATEEKFDETLDLELRVEFSILTIEPDDAKETFFREMLLNTEADLRDFKDPIAIPIYGRGRTYFALVGPGITPENIEDNCQFICGACSCEVKGQNPGEDILLAANWQSVEPGNWVSDTPLPELTGIGQFEAIVDVPETNVDADVPISDTVSTDTGSARTVTTATNSNKPQEPASETLVASVGSTTQSNQAVAKTSSSADPAASSEATLEEDQSSASFLPLAAMWAAVLFGTGLVFSVWQRRRSAE